MGDRVPIMKATWKGPEAGHIVERGASPALWTEVAQYIELSARYSSCLSGRSSPARVSSYKPRLFNPQPEKERKADRLIKTALQVSSLRTAPQLVPRL